LINDLSILQKGADTIVGERGINVSGGQKARISLARAIYSEANIYLLDDPLSAVDPQVAKNIFNNAILETLKDKLVILVTHQLQFLTECKNILVLKDNRQVGLGNYSEIQQIEGFDLHEIMQGRNKKTTNGQQATTKFAKEEVTQGDRQLKVTQQKTSLETNATAAKEP
jgi:ABC-type transport system involved in cytochrome bd biosynthesis fused ATPase/permease subunit